MATAEDRKTRPGEDSVDEPVHLEVILHKGRNLVKTFYEKLRSLMLDSVMDPYIRFGVTSPWKGRESCAIQNSTRKNNDENPVWEETFVFLLESSCDRGQLQVTLWDANYLFDEQMSQPISIDLDTFKMDSGYDRKVYSIHGDGEIELSLQIRRAEDWVHDTVADGLQKDAIAIKRGLKTGVSIDQQLFPDPNILELDVIVHQGRDLEKTFFQKLTGMMLDNTMDSFLVLKVTNPYKKAVDSAQQRSTCKYNTSQPMWEEEFSFLIDTNDVPGQLHITLWDANYVLSDSAMSSPVVVELGELEVEGGYDRRQLNFLESGVIDVSVRIRTPTCGVRVGVDLHDKEIQSVGSRRQKVAAGIQALLGMKERPPKVPTISVLCSGGGARAAIGTSGAVRALQEAGLLDCCMYIAALSGSAWYLSVLYSLKGGPDVDNCTQYLRDRCAHMGPVINVMKIQDHLSDVLKKYFDGHPVSLVNIWGEMIGKVFGRDLARQDESLLSDQQSVAGSCEVPYPIYTAVYVREGQSTDLFAEWIEFTPFEFGIRDYKLFSKMDDIASSHVLGMVTTRTKEFKLSFMQGLWGSAFASSIERWAQTMFSDDQSLAARMVKAVLEATDLDDWRPFAAVLPNYMKGMSTLPTKARRIQGNLKEIFAQYCHPGHKQKSSSGDTEFDGEPSEADSQAKVQKRDEETSFSEEATRKRLDTTRGGAGKHGPSVRFSKDDYLTVVDAGVDFNLPFPPLLRPERCTDIFLVFDYTWRQSQDEDPFKELFKAKEWADEHGWKFPNIPQDLFNPVRQENYYIIGDEADPSCPVVVFFPLCNVSRREETIPGQDESFAEVDPFRHVYSTFNFEYKREDFDHLHELCRFNTSLAVEDIKAVIAKRLA